MVTCEFDMENEEILLIFDCDGVLIDSELTGASIEIEELQRIGCRIDLEEYLPIALGRQKRRLSGLKLQRKTTLNCLWDL